MLMLMLMDDVCVCVCVVGGDYDKRINRYVLHWSSWRFNENLRVTTLHTYIGSRICMTNQLVKI